MLLGVFQRLAADAEQQQARQRGGDREQIEQRPAMGFDEPAGDRPDINAAHGGQRRQQRELGGGERTVAQRHQQRDEGRGAHAAAQVFKEDGAAHGEQVLVGHRQDPIAEIGDRLQHAEQHQGAEQGETLHQHAAEQSADDGGEQPEGFVDQPHFAGVESHAADQEGGAQAAGEGVAHFVHHDQQQDQPGVVAAEEIAQRRDDRLFHGARRRDAFIRLRRHQRGGHADQHQSGHQPVGGLPAEIAIRQPQRQAAGNQHRQPITQHRYRRARAAFFGFQQVGFIGVEHDVLRGRAERHQHRQRRQPPQVLRGLHKAHRHDRRHQQQLADQQPTAPPPEERRGIAIHEGRPEEFEDVGLAHQREDADGFQIDVFDGHPGLQRAGGQCQRQT